MKEGLYWIRAKDIGPKAKNLPEMDTWHPQKENGGITLAPQKFSKGQPLEQDSFFIFLSFNALFQFTPTLEQSCWSSSSILPLWVGTCRDIIRVRMNGRDVCTLSDRLFHFTHFFGFVGPLVDGSSAQSVNSLIAVWGT